MDKNKATKLVGLVNDGNHVTLFESGQKHYAVLCLTDDQCARIAMLAYAGACEEDDPPLSKRLIETCSFKG